MADDFFRQYAVGGAQRPDSFTGLDPKFGGALRQLFEAAPEDIRPFLRVTSGYRSPEKQQQLFAQAVQKYGSEGAARKWVAPPGRSFHNKGSAVDLKYLGPRAQAWVHANAKNYGLQLPMKHEPWHIEPIGSRGGHAHAPAGPQPAGSPAPALGPGVNVADRQVAAVAPGAAAPQAFGDMIAPQAPVSFASIIDSYAQRRRAAEEEHQAHQARLAALFAEMPA